MSVHEDEHGRVFATLSTAAVVGTRFLDDESALDALVADVRDLTAAAGLGALERSGRIPIEVGRDERVSRINRLTARVAHIRLEDGK